MGLASRLRRVSSLLAALVFGLGLFLYAVSAAFGAADRARAARAERRAAEHAQALRESAALTEPRTAPVHATRADSILERNPFDSVTGPLDRSDQGASRVAEVLCPDIELVSVVLSGNPAWSFAEIATGARRTLLHLESALEGRRLVAVEADRVRLEGKDGSCVAFLHGGSDVSSAACVASGFRLGLPCIARLTDTEFDVAAKMVDHLLEEQAELMRCARMVPEQDERGHITGVRLFGIRPGSIMAALGIENGDALQTVNDFDMTSPDRALEAYAKLRSVSDLRVGLTRKGARLVLVYHLI